MSTTNIAPHTDETQQVKRWVSRVTLFLLALLTIASVLNIHDMAEMTHTAGGFAAWMVSIAIGGTLSVLAYVASITDGNTSRMAAIFAVFAAVVSTALQVSLFLSRGAHPAVAVAFGIGVPFFEIALALTDSMLRRYSVPVPVSQTVSKADRKPAAETPARAKSATPKPTPETAPDATPATPVATPATQNTAATPSHTDAPVTKTELARQLGISRATLHRRMKTGELSLNGAAAD